MHPLPSLRELSHFRTGGPCGALHCPTSVDELAAIMRELAHTQTPYLLLGAGSNSLVLDEPWPGAVISFHRLNTYEVDGERLRCAAGVFNSRLAEIAYEHRLSGLGWMFRLPGQIGATVRMNARCYGGEISQVVTQITTLTPRGELRHYPNAPGARTLFRGYKDTIFMENGELIVGVELRLQSASDMGPTRALMDHCESDRLAKHQFLYPNCGCVFKNDHRPEVSVASGLLLELAGVKGMQRGGAVVSPYHCNFIYNQGATSSDVVELSLAMREAVWQEFGVWLSYEMEILGRLPSALDARFREQRTPAYREDRLAAARAEFQNRLRER